MQHDTEGLMLSLDVLLVKEIQFWIIFSAAWIVDETN
jgi:hypothetical protein